MNAAKSRLEDQAWQDLLSAETKLNMARMSISCPQPAQVCDALVLVRKALALLNQEVSA